MVKPGAKLKTAASSFSIYAYESLKKVLEKIGALEFIFTAPAFIPNAVTDKVSKERREFHIPKQQRERNLYVGDPGINPGRVKYDVVNSYSKLIEIVGLERAVS